MIEFARDTAGVMPRVFGSNHHPEILDRFRQTLVLENKLARGEVERSWYEERLEALTLTYPDDRDDARLHLTSDYSLLGPLRFHLHRALRLTARSILLAEDKLRARNREVLLAAGREAKERIIEREFERIDAAVRRDLTITGQDRFELIIWNTSLRRADLVWLSAPFGRPATPVDGHFILLIPCSESAGTRQTPKS